MRRFTWIFAMLLMAGMAEAQSTSTRTSAFAQATANQPAPRWDLNLAVGFFNARPEGSDSTSYDDDWYSEGRYAVGVGYYWTDNFKTEIEFAHTPEESRYVQDFVNIPGTGQVYPYSFEKFHRIQHTSVRAAYQFLDNSWVHPYVNGGFVFETERHRYHVQEQFRFPPDPRGSTPPVLLRPEFTSGEIMDDRGGVTVGGGAKFYLSPSAYINTGMQVTYAKPSTTVSFIAGFGIDF